MHRSGIDQQRQPDRRTGIPEEPEFRDCDPVAGGARPITLVFTAPDRSRPPVEWQPDSVRLLRVLGRGRAAEARLVRVRMPSGAPLVCVEKLFRPGFLTRFIYRLAFQAPFGYRVSRDAILACFYRRRVAAALIEAQVDRARVARPLYVRWDRKEQAYALAAEWVQGRGIRPASPDPYPLRRRLAGRLGWSASCPPPQPHEINELLDTMGRVENLFRSSGLVGSGWQVCIRAMVSTANLLRTADGYTVIDLESGIPAVLVPSYLRASVRLGAFPLFDDLDSEKLRDWIDSHEPELRQRLGNDGHAALGGDVERLIDHTVRWKQAEPAFGRHRWRIAGSKFRRSYRRRCIEIWQRREVIDDEAAAALRSRKRIWTSPIWISGLIPGAPGWLLQRLAGDRGFRAKCRQFFGDLAYRRTQVARLARDRLDRWTDAGRMPCKRWASSSKAAFRKHLLLATCTPPRVHRFLCDQGYRRSALIRAMLLLVSGRFQAAYARVLIHSAVGDWQRSERLSPEEAAVLREQLASKQMDEYAQCFGLHLGLKLLAPFLVTAKVGGTAAFFASGNPLFLLPLMALPAARTAVTLWWMLGRRRRKPIPFAEALVVGALPVVGVAAYPVQMYAAQRELSSFLLRDSAARAGRWIPIYGGKDSRTEMAMIRLADLAMELMELSLRATAALRRWLPAPVAAEPTSPGLRLRRQGRWDRLVDEQLDRLEREFGDSTEQRELDERSSAHTGRIAA